MKSVAAVGGALDRERTAVREHDLPAGHEIARPRRLVGLVEIGGGAIVELDDQSIVEILLN